MKDTIKIYLLLLNVYFAKSIFISLRAFPNSHPPKYKILCLNTVALCPYLFEGRSPLKVDLDHITFEVFNE